MGLSDRDIERVVIKSIETGSLRITRISKNGEEIVEAISEECNFDYKCNLLMTHD